MGIDPKFKAFFAVAEAGSISRAANKIGLTQSALSKLIRRLEEEFDCALIERQPRGVNLTKAGEVLLRRAERAAMEFSHAREEMAALAAEKMISFRIGCGPIYSFGWMHYPVQILSERYPNIEFEVSGSPFQSGIGRLLRGEFDAYFGFIDQNAADDNLQYIPIRNVETLVFCRKDHPLLQRESISAKDLAAQSWSVFSDVGLTNAALDNTIRMATGAMPHVRFKSDSMTTALSLAASSDSLVCAPSPLERYVETIGLKRLKVDTVIWSYQSGCLLRRSSLRYDIILELVKLISEEASSWEFV